MSNEIKLLIKDSIKLNILKELLNGTVKLRVQLNNEPSQDYAAQIHSQSSRMHVCGKFNISESPDGEMLTIRSTASGVSLRLYPSISAEIIDKTIGIYRSASKALEREIPLDSSISVLDISPNNDSGYTLRIISSEPLLQGNDQQNSIDIELTAIENQTAKLENKRAELEELKSSAAKRLEIIEQEYQKEQSAYQSELDELRSRMTADEAVVRHYKDKDITSTEALLSEIKSKLDEAEAQIRLFIEAKQKKSIEIENEIKSGNKV